MKKYTLDLTVGGLQARIVSFYGLFSFAFINRIPIPFLILYVAEDYFNESNTLARLNFCCIRVRGDHRHNKALLVHELIHCKQTLETFFLHFIFYNISDTYMYYAEIEAYVAQCKFLLVNSGFKFNKLPIVLIDELATWAAFSLHQDLVEFNHMDVPCITIKKEIIKHLDISLVNS